MNVKNLVSMGVTPNSLKKFINDLNTISLPNSKKKLILVRTLQKIKKNSVSNTANQRSPDGSSWAPRKKGKGKMLKRIAKVISSKGDVKQAKLFYREKRTSKIAAEHQYGIDHLFIKKDFNKDREKNKNPCSIKQAKKLKDLGYKVSSGKKYKSGKVRYRTPSIREIQSKLTVDQAGVLISRLSYKNNSSPSKGLTSWIIPTKKRPFLETDQRKNIELMTKIIHDFLYKDKK